jgi:serine/threonine-protein kinase RsbT
MPRILAVRQMRIASEVDVVHVRRAVRDVARDRGFDPFATAAITTAASELGRNAWVHAAGGDVVIQELVQGQRAGLRLCFDDQGPGIPDLQQAISGMRRSVRSLGLGLAGSQRLVDEFEIRSAPGVGTTVTVVKWVRWSQ